VHQANRLRLTFLVATGFQVAAVYAGFPLAPYAGTVAMAALLALALTAPRPATRTWTHVAAAVGLTLLTMAALLVDQRTGGFGWPMELGGGEFARIRFDDDGGVRLVAEAVLLVVGAGALAAAVLGRVEGLFRRRILPGVVVGLVALAVAVDEVLYPESIFGSPIATDTGLRLRVLMPAAVVIAVLWLAAYAALTPRVPLLPAAAGMLVVAALAWTGFAGLSGMDSLRVPEVPAEETVAYEDRFRLEPRIPGSVVRIEAYTRSGEQPRPRAEDAGVLVDVSAVDEAVWWTSVDGWRAGIGPVPLPREGERSRVDARGAVGTTLVAAGLAGLVMSLFPFPYRPRGSLY
jgi:hypothetical protein